MRDEFYGDRKDVWKWSVLLRLAGSDRDVWFIAMRCPNKGRHGNDKSYCAPDHRILGSVEKFFDSERACNFDGCRSIGRVKALLPGRIRIVDDDFSNRSRFEYFESVSRRLSGRAPSNNSVVFCDPDNGIAGRTVTRAHLKASDLATLSSACRRGDTLVAYQHQFRDCHWREKRFELFCGALGGKWTCTQENFAAVSFYIAESA